METIEALRRDIAYNAWANRRSAATVTDTNAPALRVLSHLVLADKTWLDRIDGETSMADIWQTSTASLCMQMLEANEARLTALVQGLNEAGLDQAASYRNSRGEPFSTSYRDILSHMLKHAMYHRGQIASLVRAQGSEPAATDYILYVRALDAA